MTSQPPIDQSEHDAISQAFAVTVAVTLFIGMPLWVLIETGSTAFCRIYECPINRQCPAQKLNQD